MSRPRPIAVVVAVFFVVVCALFFAFTVEDAYIVSRYAANLANDGELVFNYGERICALTSPLHSLVETLLTLIFGAPRIPFKFLSLILLLVSAGLAFRLFRNSEGAQAAVALIMIISPCVILWTLGGLETPLLLFLVTALTVLSHRNGAPNPRTLCLLHVLAGLAFVTRYDSAVFVLPIVLWSWTRARNVRWILLAVAVGLIVPVAWVTFSAVYYQDLLPTSFYVKTPSFRPAVINTNGRYIALHLVLAGVVPYAVFLLARPGAKVWTGILRSQVRAMWGLHAGVALMLIYGLASATQHMMFSFRYFVPYLPATAILLGDLCRRRDELDVGPAAAGPKPAAFRVLLAAMLVFQVIQVGWIYTRSLEGFPSFGVYTRTGVRNYTADFIPTLILSAEDMRSHWNSLGMERTPRIHTFAAGAMPYVYHDAYIYEKLVSFRHNCSYDLRTTADYLHLMAPRHGSVEHQLVKPVASYELVSSHVIFFDGRSETLFVFHDPEPAPNRLPPGVRDRCLGQLPGERSGRG